MTVGELIKELSKLNKETELLRSDGCNIDARIMVIIEQDTRKTVGVFLKEELDPDLERHLDNSDLD